MKYLKQLSIKSKLLGTLSLLIIAILVISALSYTSMLSIGERIVSITEEDIPLTKSITAVTLAQLEQAISFEQAMRYGEEVIRDKTDPRHFKQAVTRFDALNTKIVASLAESRKLAERVVASAHSEQVRSEFTSVNEQLGQIKKAHDEFEQHVHETLTLLLEGQLHAARGMAERVEQEEHELDKSLEELLLEIEQFTLDSAKNAEAYERQAAGTILTIALISIALGMTGALIIVYSITQGLTHTVKAMNDIAEGEGDLTTRLDEYGRDEVAQVAQAFNRYSEKIRSTIEQVSGSAAQPSSAAEEMSSITQETNSGVQQQQMETDQVATAMNEMTATVQEVARNANDAADAALNADKETHTGRGVVGETISAINGLAQEMESASGVINKLESDSESIGTVLDVIRGIAEQTNLLALNAAIEAARAGEQGRGFAVVADEVRTLASRTQQSTQEIQEMIEQLQGGAQNAVQVMDQSLNRAKSGAERAAEAGTSLEAIAQAVSTINDMNTQIASAAEEQSAVAEEINHNVVNISEAVAQTASASEQTSIASDELARLATDLQGLVMQFKI